MYRYFFRQNFFGMGLYSNPTVSLSSLKQSFSKIKIVDLSFQKYNDFISVLKIQKVHSSISSPCPVLVLKVPSNETLFQNSFIESPVLFLISKGALQ